MTPCISSHISVQRYQTHFNCYDTFSPSGLKFLIYKVEMMILVLIAPDDIATIKVHLKSVCKLLNTCSIFLTIAF